MPAGSSFNGSTKCYTPAAKRVHGYFVLPLLHQGRLVGRLDAKAHRAQAVFEVKALYLEPGVVVDEPWVAAVAAALWRCARWHGAARIRLTRTSPSALAVTIRRALRQCSQEMP